MIFARHYSKAVPKPVRVGQAQRRAATRERIVVAGNRLFESKGYDDTSISDISAAAGVAMRTIYLHFDSKAAILLAYFDDWLDEYVAAVCAGPVDENIDDAMIRSFGTLDLRGQIDNRRFDEMGAQHPSLAILLSSNLDITGHVLRSWVAAQDVLTEHFRRSLRLPVDSVVARARAAAIFATWMATLLAYRDEREGRLESSGPLHEVAISLIRLYGAGLNGADETG